MLGGGPAGLAFATLAARAGARVILAERTGYHRPRPGEHLAGEIRAALAALAVNREAAAAVLEQSAGIVSDWGTALPLTKSYGGTPGGAAFNADRLGFDRLLRDTASRAGAVCLAGAHLVEAARGAGGSWRLRLATADGPRAIEAGFIVDATGRRAAFARGQRARQARAGDLTAITTWYSDRPGRPAAQPLIVAASGPGWWGLTATPGDGWAASFYTSAALLRRSRQLGAGWTLADPPLVPLVANRLVGAVPLGRQAFVCWPQVRLPMQGPGWIAVGEAAAAFDPICGRGVAYAIETAFRAFEAAAGRGLGDEYQAALCVRMKDHLAARAQVYGEAGARLDPEFLQRAAYPGFAPDPAITARAPL